MAKRFWELDAARGIAVVFMVVFNWSFTLRFFDVYTVASGTLFWYWEVFPRLIAGTFLFIVGVALTLSFHRFQRRTENWGEHAPRKYARRGLKIVGYGLLVTVATYVFNPEMYVFFGILHVIGVSIILAYPFIHRPRTSLLAAVLVFGFAWFVSRVHVSVEELAAFGFSTATSTFDLFPVLPWFGVVLLGIAAGHVFYPAGERRFPVPDTYTATVVEKLRQGVAWLGRYSLEIYLLHQPVLLAVLWIVNPAVL